MNVLKMEEKWLKDATNVLKGKTIEHVRFMTVEEQEDFGWNYRPIVLQLDDGNIIYPVSDDEGNEAGALFTNDDDLPGIPVMR